MKKLYSNIGDKVCKVAKFCGFIGLVCAIIGLCALLFGFMDSEDELMLFGGIAAFFGILSLVSSWPLYAFGQITNDVHAMRTNAPAKASAKQFSDLPEL